MTMANAERANEVRGSAFTCEEALKAVPGLLSAPLQLDYISRLIWTNPTSGHPSFVSFDDVVDAHLAVDEVNESGRSTTSMIGRGAIFGLLTGGAGAVIGAMSAKTVQRRKIKSVVLTIEFKTNVRASTLKIQLHHWGSFKGYESAEAIRIGERVIKKLLAPAPAAPAFLSPPITDDQVPACPVVQSTAEQCDTSKRSFPSLAELIQTSAQLNQGGILSVDEMARVTKKLLALKTTGDGCVPENSYVVSAVVLLDAAAKLRNAGRPLLGDFNAVRALVVSGLSIYRDDQTIAGLLEMARESLRKLKA